VNHLITNLSDLSELIGPGIGLAHQANRADGKLTLVAFASRSLRIPPSACTRLRRDES